MAEKDIRFTRTGLGDGSKDRLPEEERLPSGAGPNLDTNTLLPQIAESNGHREEFCCVPAEYRFPD